MSRERPLTLLLVEDDPTDAELMIAQLAQSRGVPGIEVERVALVGDAQRRLARRDVDVVLLDLRLPDTMGLDGLTRLVQEFPEVPVVVLTGMDDEALGLRAVQEGAQDFLVKGRSETALIERSLRYAIERKRAEQALARLAAIMTAMCYDCGQKLNPEPGRFRDS